MWCEIGSWTSVIADAVQEKMQNTRPLGAVRTTSRTGLLFGLAFTVAACSTIDSMFAGDEPPPAARTSAAGAPAKSGTANDKDFPKLSTVPARPERPTPPPQQGLAADRSGARYADSDVKPVNEAADAVVGQRLGASTARPGGAVAAAPAAAAPVGAVQPAPTTPVQPQAAASAPAQRPSTAVQSAPVAAPVAQAPMPAPVPMATTLPPPPAPSHQALVLPPTTRPRVGAVSGRAPGAAAPAPVYYGNNLQIAVVQFGRASSGLSGDDLAVLRDVAEIQKKQGGTIRIVGHASQDTTATDVQRLQEGNYAVSLARANAIANHLTRLGVPRGAVVVEAASDQQPEYDPVTAVAVASNRRAEIYLAF